MYRFVLVENSNRFLNIVLFEPEIPNNTGNIGRTCIGANCRLHLVEPLGFEISDKQLKRSGLDYWPHLDWRIHASWDALVKQIDNPSRLFFVETGSSQTIYDHQFKLGDWIVFGKETTGVPSSILENYDARVLSLPMYGPIRSFNLANTVAVVTLEALRQFRAEGLI